MPKITIFIFTLLSFFYSSMAQQNFFSQENMDIKVQPYISIEGIIEDCLEYCIDSLEYFERPNILTNYYPFNIDIIGIINNHYWNPITIKKNNQNKVFKNKTHILFFDGIDIKENNIVFFFSSRYIEFNKKRLNIAYEGWFRFYYKYNTQSNKWILSKKEIGGI